jgi:hypothetical protein
MMRDIELPQVSYGCSYPGCAAPSRVRLVPLVLLRALMHLLPPQYRMVVVVVESDLAVSRLGCHARLVSFTSMLILKIHTLLCKFKKLL